MKKIFCLVCLVLLTSSAGFCAITNRDMVDATYMKNQGYSDETIRLSEMQVYNPTTERRQDKESWAHWAWRKFNMYFDPAYDNGNFGRANIEFINRWDEI